jgi:hypothetical protein
MSPGSPKLARREQAIEAARRRLRRLEIETHRIKAELARLEADYEDDVADWLSRKLRRRVPGPVHGENEQSLSHMSLAPVDGAPAVVAFDLSPGTGLIDPGYKKEFEANSTAGTGVADPGYKKGTGTGIADPGYKRTAAKDFAFKRARAAPSPASPAISICSSAEDAPRPRTRNRKSTSPLLLSFAVHAVGLVLCMTFTFATLVQQITPLLASPVDIESEIDAQISEVEIEPTKFEDAELQNVVAERDEFNLADNLSRELDPVHLGAGARSLGDIGQLDALPGDLGTLMAGAGSPGAGKPGGPVGEAVFFGARSKGDRFVFVIDNSSSMKDGRLEAATAELLRTIDALAPRQSFYVIFVSDQTYPMFYPAAEAALLPATAANKQRLAAWLPKAILASGKNRELIKALDMAAALRPQAVFLLWDGDLKYSDKVRLDVMTHLTQRNEWDFVINTLGMGINSLDAEYNLTAIAQAHGGTFRRIEVPSARPR